MTHKVVDRRLDDEKLLLRIDVSIANVGDVLVDIERAIVYVNQILLVPETVLSSIDSEKGVENFNNSESMWPNLVTCERIWEPRMFEIEPGERDDVTFDFVVSPDIETIEIYTHFRNAKKRSRDVGWEHTSIHKFTDIFA